LIKHNKNYASQLIINKEAITSKFLLNFGLSNIRKLI